MFWCIAFVLAAIFIFVDGFVFVEACLAWFGCAPLFGARLLCISFVEASLYFLCRVFDCLKKEESQTKRFLHLEGPHKVPIEFGTWKRCL